MKLLGPPGDGGYGRTPTKMRSRSCTVHTVARSSSDEAPTSDFERLSDGTFGEAIFKGNVFDGMVLSRYRCENGSTSVISIGKTGPCRRVKVRASDN